MPNLLQMEQKHGCTMMVFNISSVLKARVLLYIGVVVEEIHEKGLNKNQ